MRFFCLLSFATFVISTVSALPVSKINDIEAHDLVSALPVSKFNGPGIKARNLDILFLREIEDLEIRAKHHQHKKTGKRNILPPSPITFEKDVSSHSAHNVLDKFHLHGKSRKGIEDYHKKLVTDYMKTVPGAHTAKIKQLAHSKGSVDPHVHVSAVIRDKNGMVVEAPRRGDPTKLDKTHHIYTNPKNTAEGYDVLPHEYKKAVDRHNRNIGHPTGKGSI